MAKSHEENISDILGREIYVLKGVVQQIQQFQEEITKLQDEMSDIRYRDLIVSKLFEEKRDKESRDECRDRKMLKNMCPYLFMLTALYYCLEINFVPIFWEKGILFLLIIMLYKLYIEENLK